MKLITKLSLLSIGILFFMESLAAQGCNLPFKYASKELTQREQTLLSFVADANRLIFDIDSYRYTNTVASLSVYVDGNMVKGVAIKKGRSDTYFALNNLDGKHIEIKGHKASPTNRRDVKIYVKKVISTFNKNGRVASQGDFTTRIPPSGKRGFPAFAACNGKAKLLVSVTNSNLANMVVRVRQSSNSGNILQTFTLGGTTKSFIRYIESDKDLYIEITNTNPSMRKDIRASVRYTNSVPSFNVNN